MEKEPALVLAGFLSFILSALTLKVDFVQIVGLAFFFGISYFALTRPLMAVASVVQAAPFIGVLASLGALVAYKSPWTWPVAVVLILGSGIAIPAWGKVIYARVERLRSRDSGG